MVTSPPVRSTARRLSAEGTTSGRWRSIWLGAPPRTVSNSVRATGIRSGCATQVPSQPSFASRRLSSVTIRSAAAVTTGSRRFGMNALIPPMA